MKRLFKLLILILLGVSLFFGQISYYVERMYTSEHLKTIVASMDLMAIVKTQIPDQYEAIVETDEFQTIVYEYANTFVHYLCGEQVTYTISQQQEKALFNQYASTYIEKYPQLKLLPSDLLIDFLVEKIDLNDYLPTFEEIERKIPQELFAYKDCLISTEFRLFLLFIILCCLFVLRKKILLFLGIAFLISVAMLGLLYFVPMNGYENIAVLLLKELQIEMKYSIISSVICFGLNWGIKYAKKIFLF